jgi:DNA-binding FadR family transcriptional regulator
VQKSDESPLNGRRYLAVAQNLLSQITGGAYPPGSRLPAHTEIAAQAGVSRATAREAFLVLEIIGAVEVRHGDGTFVRGPAVRVGGINGSALDAPPRELIETRLQIEPVVASLVAVPMQPERLAVLSEHVDQQQALVDEPDQVARFVTLGLEFHAHIAPACGNSLLADIVGQLVNIERHPLWALVNQQAMADEAARQLQVDEHRAILDAFRHGRAELAGTEMRRHLGGLDRTMFESGSPANNTRASR